jgi:apolipoprotein D and lipocalin family protein
MKILPLVTLISLFSCSSPPPLKKVDSVNINKFMGRWYVIANIPTFIEEGAHNAVETYTWNEKENRIDVLFEFNQDSFGGKKKKLPQKAFIFDKQTNSEWRIQMFWPLKFPYYIIDLAEDYSYTVIGLPSRKYLWIMARTPSLDEKTYEEIVSRVKKLDYDITLIKKVPQKW